MKAQIVNLFVVASVLVLFASRCMAAEVWIRCNSEVTYRSGNQDDWKQEDNFMFSNGRVYRMEGAFPVDMNATDDGKIVRLSNLLSPPLNSTYRILDKKNMTLETKVFLGEQLSVVLQGHCVKIQHNTRVAPP